MASEENMPANVQSMFYVESDGVPWHGEGNAKERAQTAKEAIIAAGADWRVSRVPLIYNGKPVQNKHLIIRENTDEVLGVVGNDYYPIQNVDAFGFMDLVAPEGAYYRTAGVLRNGEVLWAMLTLPGEYYVTKDDRITKNLFLTWSHNGSRSLTIGYTDIRAVCENTCQLALGQIDGKNGGLPSVRIKHTAGAKNEIKVAHFMLGLATHRGALMEQIYKRMTKYQVTEQQVAELARMIFPSAPEDRGLPPSHMALENRKGLVMAYLHPENTLDHTEGTAWALFNAVTHYVDHSMAVKTDRVESSLMGRGARMKQKAFDYIKKIMGL